MTVAEARKELARPLVFGDAQQIKARDILRKVQDCKDAILACEYEHGGRGSKARAAVKNCDCVETWAPETWAPELPEELGGDWDIVNASLRELGL